MEDGQQQEDGWQARDNRSGVAKVFADAKQRSIVGVYAVTAWAVVVFLFAVANLLGLMAVSPLWWDFAAGSIAGLLATLAVSRNPTAFTLAAGVVVVDLVFLAFRIPTLQEFGTTTDAVGTGTRILVAPAALYFVLMGYVGCLSIQAFKAGFSPGVNWRTRLSPLMLQSLVIGTCLVSVGLGVALWYGAIRAGFAEEGVEWAEQEWVDKAMEVAGAKKSAAETEEEEAADSLMRYNPFSEDQKKLDAEFVVPEIAIPIESTKGLDAFARRAVEEAFEFASETDQAGCLNEAQGRQGRCRDDRCIYWARVFARACLPKSKPTPKFCDSVPDPTLRSAGMTWAMGMCAGRDLEPCRELLFAVQGNCHPSKVPVARKP